MAKKSKKSKLPQEFIDKILRMKPEDLAVEAARCHNQLDIAKEDIKNDTKLNDLKDQLEKFEDELDGHPDVVEAEDHAEKIRDENTSKDHVDAREQLKALRKGLNGELKETKLQYKFMRETLKTHMRSGLLKSRMD
jgi:hypothetical protein